MRFLIICFVFFSFFGACVSKRNRFTDKPTKSISNPDNDLLQVNTVLFNNSETSTTVYLNIDNENLIYKRPDTTVNFYAEIKIKYIFFNENNIKKIIDSLSFKFVDKEDEQIKNKQIPLSFKLNTQNGNNYLLDLVVTDVNKKTNYNQAITINRKNHLSRQNFLTTSNSKISYKNTFLALQEVNVTLNTPIIKTATVDCFFTEFPIALPPFSNKFIDELKYKPDSSFVISISNSNFDIIMPENGFYHLKFGDDNNEGLTLYTFDEAFPGINNSKEMVLATRYIMTKQEYETCITTNDYKASIDKFWLSIGGSNERAKELLKRYYNRVKESNKLYTSYNKGWKTDRGMIFIIFGKPTQIYKNSRGETWVYGLENNPSTFRFTFYKTQNPFSNNDYVLERSQYYKEQWYLAVDYWRQGRVYNVFER